MLLLPGTGVKLSGSREEKKRNKKKKQNHSLSRRQRATVQQDTLFTCFTAHPEHFLPLRSTNMSDFVFISAVNNSTIDCLGRKDAKFKRIPTLSLLVIYASLRYGTLCFLLFAATSGGKKNNTHTPAKTLLAEKGQTIVNL